MPKKGRIDINYLADLARIELTDEERERFAQQLKDILAYFERLEAVDVSAVEPTAHAFPVYNVWEEDKAVEGFAAEEALQNAPAVRDNQIQVPRVVEEA